MAATPITPSTRYIPPGTTQYYWVPSIANIQAPSRAELDAGTDLTGEVADVAGFSQASDQVDTPDLKTRFVPKIPGRINAADSSLTLYASADSNDARSLMPIDAVGNIVVFGEGDTPALKMDVYPVKVSSPEKQRAVEDPSKIMFAYSVTAAPAENITVPS